MLEEQKAVDFEKAAAVLQEATNAKLQQMRGKRAQAYKHQNPRPAQQQGRVVPKKIHSSDLNPMSAEIEERFLRDIEALDKKNRQITRNYMPGEANPYAMPEGRTVVVVTAKQRVYKVDGKPVLYVDLKHIPTDAEKAAAREAEAERRKNKTPGGEKGKRPFRVVREVIMEREI